MKQTDLILRLVKRNPGLTATGYTKLLCGDSNRYKPATVLRELHRWANKGVILRQQGLGMIHGKAWRFYLDNRPL